MHALRIFLILSTAVALAGCATSIDVGGRTHETLFEDRLFDAPVESVGPDQIFAMTDEMRRYARDNISRLTRKHKLHDALIKALYRSRELRLEYEATYTRTAAQTFEARAGNCLSLVIMTAAFAKELGIPVSYQSVQLEETWSRNGNLLIGSGHVNVTLGTRFLDRPNGLNVDRTIDFLPQEDLRHVHTREIPESRIISMFMNNRAVEAMVQGRLDDAYAWARESVRADSEHLGAYNTLGLVYLRRGALVEAAKVFEHVLSRNDRYARALSNLAEVRTRQGRDEDAARLRVLLGRLEQQAPLHFFSLGLEAMERQDYRAARDLFAKEAARGDATGPVYFWLGVANVKLGNVEQAVHELRRATKMSTTRIEREIYSAKLQLLSTNQTH